MTLSEKIINKLRQDKDSGWTSKQLAILFMTREEKVESAARAMQEQEHLILGSDGCWYLGDVLALGGKYEPPQSAQEPVYEPVTVAVEKTPDFTEETVSDVLEQMNTECVVDPFGFQVSPPAPEPKKPKPLPATNQFGALPALVVVKRWVETRSEIETPISWTEFSKQVGIRKTTLGKARASLLGRGETELVAKLDRLVYRENSQSMRERAGIETHKSWPAINKPDLTIPSRISEYLDLLKGFDELRSALNKPALPPPGPISEYIDLLKGFDDLCESQGLGPERIIRKRISELMTWLRGFQL